MCTRVFVESGILDELERRSPYPLVALLAHDNFRLSEYKRRFGKIKFLTLERLLEGESLSFFQKLGFVLDRWLDRYFGFYPLALRQSLKHGFNTDRWMVGHKNAFHNPDMVGPAPMWDLCFNAMRWWYFSGMRFFNPAIGKLYMDENVAGLLVNNSQTPIIHAFAHKAKEMRIPMVNYVASWDHPIGKGVFPSYYDRYIVQNRVMKDALRRYHGIPTELVTITGWPQMDKYGAKRSVNDFHAALAKWGLDPGRPVVMLAGNTPVNSPYEHYLYEKIINWRDENGGADRWSVIMRPHPKDTNCKERFRSLIGRDGVHFQHDTLMDMDLLATLLANVSCVVCTGGTILLDSLVNDRPVVGVTYDQNAPEGSGFARSNYTMRHYSQVWRSGAFYRADNFEQTLEGIERSLTSPGDLSARRKDLSKQIAGDMDGGAVTRVVDAALETLTQR